PTEPKGRTKKQEEAAAKRKAAADRKKAAAEQQLARERETMRRGDPEGRTMPWFRIPGHQEPHAAAAGLRQPSSSALSEVLVRREIAARANEPEADEQAE